MRIPELSMTILKHILRPLLPLALITLGGCASQSPAIPDDPDWAPVSNAAAALPSPNPGGIYRPGAGLGLYADRRAHRIGDVLTITLAENTRSSKQAQTGISKESSVNMNAGPLLGRNPRMGDYNLETAINQNREFQGDANSGQSNNLQGSITVTVVDVLSNGLLVVRGEKWLTLNRGDEFIRLRGLVRPEDIAPNNTIASTKVADVRIAYAGTGDFAAANQQGWASRFFNSSLWPF